MDYWEYEIRSLVNIASVSDMPCSFVLFRFVSINFVSLYFVPLRFVSLRSVSFRYGKFRFVSFRFACFVSRFISHFTGTLRKLLHDKNKRNLSKRNETKRNYTACLSLTYTEGFPKWANRRANVDPKENCFMIKIKYAQRTGEQQIWEGNEDIDVRKWGDSLLRGLICILS
jgi:hypothetical protein